MPTEHPDLNGPEHFTGHASNPHVKSFMEIMTAQGRERSASHTISIFVRAQIPVWMAEQTLASLTFALKHIPVRRGRGKASLSIVASEEPK